MSDLLTDIQKELNLSKRPTVTGIIGKIIGKSFYQASSGFMYATGAFLAWRVFQ